MNIPEAIEILFAVTHNHNITLNPEFPKAVKLGIEALKQIKWLHESQVLHDDELLPGETKE